MINIYLDGTLVDSPSNWRDITSTLKYDETLRAVLLQEDTTLEFVGSGYDYLNTISQTGYCNTISISIKDDCGSGVETQLIDGIIFISDASFNERTCTASVKVRDKSFYSKIFNNKNIEFSPDINKSKNFDDITAATVYNLDVYNLSNVLLRSNVDAIRIYEVLRVAIAFMTDNAVTFASTLFDIGGEFEGLCITDGYRLRTGTTTAWPKIKFEELIDELQAIAPIQFTIENPYSAPVFRVELESYFQGSGVALTIDNVYQVIRKFAVDKLYANVHIGSTETDTDITLAFPETIPYVGFNDETYYLTGECNIDTTLEITGSWCRSSNAIQRTAIIGSQANDDKIFLIDSTLVDASNGRTKNSNFLNLDPPVYYYNEPLTNQAIFDRYVGAFPSAIAAAAGNTGDGLFKSFAPSLYSFGTGAIGYFPVNFSNVAFNTGGYFDGTDTFTATVAGVYDFTVFLDINLLTFTGGGSVPATNLSCELIQFDSTGTQLRTLTVFNYRVHSAGSYPISGTERVVMNANDYLIVAFTKIDSFGNASTGEITTNSYWECTENTVGSGVFKDYNYLDYPINIYEFEYPISKDDWDTILSNPNKYISFAMNGKSFRSGYVREVKRNHATGVGSFKLINTYRQNAD